MLTLVIQDGVATAAEVGLDQPPVLAVGRPAVFDRHGLAFDEANFPQPLVKRSRYGGVYAGRLAVEEPNHRHRWLLRMRATEHAKNFRRSM